MRTISLIDRLRKFNSPKYIEHLSIDTEGSEYEILNAHNFAKFKFGVITIEHNYTGYREWIHELLKENGFDRKYESLSGFDYWYINENGS